MREGHSRRPSSSGDQQGAGTVGGEEVTMGQVRPAMGICLTSLVVISGVFLLQRVERGRTFLRMKIIDNS